MTSNPADPTLLAGRYRLAELLGRGGMAEVYAAEDEVLRRRVAVKVFRSGAAGAEAPRVDAEIRTIAGLRHPGVVTVFDASTTGAGGPPYIVMDLVPGPTLAHRLAGGPLTSADTAVLGSQLADVLAHVHAAGIVHRDLKPANILLDAPTAGAPFTARLTDFGIARLVDSTRLTTVGLTVGTAGYLSPEQALGEPAGPPSDIYSLGLVLLECLTGRVAFPGSGVATAGARLHRPPEIPAELPDGWPELLAAMTARDPAARPTAEQVYRQLAAGRHRTAALPVEQPAGPGLEPTRRLPAPPDAAAPPGAGAPSLNRRLLVAAAAVLVLAVLVLLLVAPPGRHSGSADPRPSYPSVSGNLGQHLRQLQGAVG